MGYKNKQQYTKNMSQLQKALNRHLTCIVLRKQVHRGYHLFADYADRQSNTYITE